MSDLKYRVALTRISGLGPKKFEALSAAFPDLEAAWFAEADRLVTAGLDRTTALAVVEARSRVDPEDEIRLLEHCNVRAIPRGSRDYPARLEEIYDPPPILYVRGEILDADQRSVAVVGTRRPTTYGKEVARRLVRELAAQRVTIVSGLARGIDGIAHSGALETAGRTIGVLGSGLDTIYPAEHLEMAKRIVSNGALLSEHPPGARLNARNFPRRNRIISAMSLGVLVVEAAFKSGAMLTVEHAVQQNREVFAVPGSILSDTSTGTNWLIQQGAKLVTRAEDILEELNIAESGRQMSLGAPEPATELEQQLLSGISGDPTHIDDLTRASGLSSAVVASTLALMELRGLVRQAGPMLYVRN